MITTSAFTVGLTFTVSSTVTNTDYDKAEVFLVSNLNLDLFCLKPKITT